MQIKAFSVKNFRSITTASELPLYDFSILIGPNNEGKSNLLKALVISLKLLDLKSSDWQYIGTHPSSKDMKTGKLEALPRDLRRRTLRPRLRRRSDDDELRYDWERDFPINLQKNIPDGRSEFEIDFSLNEKEKSQYQTITHKKLHGELRVQILRGRQSYAGYMTFFDTHDLKKSVKNLMDIAKFVSDKIQVQYITAIRTQSRTISIIDSMISGELSLLENQKRYQKLMKQIEIMQKPILDELSANLTESVSGFLPQVKKIHLDSKEMIRRMMHESTNVYVDDGTNTLLELKGDGIKSLMAISIIQHVTKQHAQRRNIILAIEEPESHLHPEAIHKLKKVIEDISSKNQVIISTHSPLLVNRSEIARNLIVDKSRAAPAKSIAEIRDILGVKIADNLRSANLIILTEGEEDSVLLKSWLIHLSEKIKNAINNGDISFDNLGGGNNLSYKVSLWKNLLCDIHAFLDNDDTGKKGYAEAESKGLISLKDATFTTISNYKESEIEDLVSPDTYRKEVSQRYGVNLDTSEFKNSKRKWSLRMQDTFKKNGKIWDDNIKSDVKKLVAKQASLAGMKSINQHNLKPIRSMVESLETYLDNRVIH
jgi:putative ATP-dependent endonuclease of OLD family